MNRYIINRIAVVLVVAMTLPLFSSCSLFKKKAVLTAASNFGSGVSLGVASDILQMTDGLEKEYKKSFKDLL